MNKKGMRIYYRNAWAFFCIAIFFGASSVHPIIISNSMGDTLLGNFSCIDISDTHTFGHQDCGLTLESSNAIAAMDSRIINNSNAIVSTSQLLIQISNHVLANSNAIVRLDQRVTQNSNAIVSQDLRITNNSNAIIALSQQLLHLSDFVVANSNAIVSGAATNALSIQNSNAIIALSQNVLHLSDFVVANSNAIVRLDQRVTQNSNAIASQDLRITNNSNAIVSTSLLVLQISNHVLANSNAIVRLDQRVTQNSNAIASQDLRITNNSNAIVSTSQLVLQISNHVLANSNAIVRLDQRVTQNSNAIASQDLRITNNSNAIVSTSLLVLQISNHVLANSNAIVRLDQRVTQNSNAIASQDLRITNNSNAIVSTSLLVLQISNHVLANSNAIVRLDQRVTQNSNAIASQDQRITNNSNAIIALSQQLLHLSDFVVANSNAIASGGASSALAIQNSNAIIALSQQLLHLSDFVVANSNAIVVTSALPIQNSNAIVRLDQRVTQNSNAIVSQDQRITNNSNAIIAISQQLLHLSNFVVANSNAIVAINATATQLPIQNSNAILALSQTVINLSNFVIAVSNTVLLTSQLPVQNSNAIVRLDQRVTQNSNAIVAINVTAGTDINLANAQGSITVNHQRGINFWVNATNSLTLTLTDEARVIQERNSSTELKSGDSILVFGERNIIDITNTFSINGTIVFDPGAKSELIFQFNTAARSPLIVFGNPAIGLSLPSRATLRFQGNGTVAFADGFVIELTQRDGDYTSLIVSDGAILGIRPPGDALSSVTIRGKGRLLLDDGGAIVVDANQHLIIGGVSNSANSNLEVVVDHGAIIRIAGVQSRLSTHLFDGSYTFEQFGQLFIGAGGVVEFNSVLGIQSPGTISKISFGINGELDIKQDGSLLLGENLNNTKLLWDGRGATIGGLGLVTYLHDQNFSGRPLGLAPNVIATMSMERIMRVLLNLQPLELTQSTVFTDANGDRKLRVKDTEVLGRQAPIVLLLPTDILSSEDAGGVEGVGREGGFLIDTFGNRQGG